MHSESILMARKMKKIISIFLFHLFIILLMFPPGCKSNSTEPSEISDISSHDTTHFPVNTRKPNIYIYPAALCSLSIKLEFPAGGTIIKSIPQYQNGWNITVNKSGRINNEYDYLFYECVNPDLYQHNTGWVVSKDSLLPFFSNNLIRAGFNDREKNDFIEYWIPRLTDYPYYIIYPQFSEDIEKIICLKFSIEPDKVLRLFYAIKGSNSSDIKLKTPEIPKFERSGFVVTEWGVVI